MKILETMSDSRGETIEIASDDKSACISFKSKGNFDGRGGYDLRYKEF